MNNPKSQGSIHPSSKETIQHEIEKSEQHTRELKAKLVDLEKDDDSDAPPPPLKPGHGLALASKKQPKKKK